MDFSDNFDHIDVHLKKPLPPYITCEEKDENYSSCTNSLFIPSVSYICELIDELYYVCKDTIKLDKKRRVALLPKVISIANTSLGLPNHIAYILLHPINLRSSHPENKELSEYKYLEELLAMVNNKTWSAKAAFKLGKKYFNL